MTQETISELQTMIAENAVDLPAFLPEHLQHFQAFRYAKMEELKQLFPGMNRLALRYYSRHLALRQMPLTFEDQFLMLQFEVDSLRTAD